MNDKINLTFFTGAVISVIATVLIYVFLRWVDVMRDVLKGSKGGKEPKGNEEKEGGALKEPTEKEDPKKGTPPKGMAMKSFALPSLDSDMKKVSILTTDQNGTLQPLEEVVFSKENNKKVIDTSSFDLLKTKEVQMTHGLTIADTDTSGTFISGPDGSLKLSARGIMIGGPRNKTGRAINSCTISTLWDPDSLSIVGQGNERPNRRVRVYDQLYVGDTHTKDPEHKLCIGSTCINEDDLNYLQKLKTDVQAVTNVTTGWNKGSAFVDNDADIGLSFQTKVSGPADCLRLALKNPAKYKAWGYRSEKHPIQSYKNTCFLYTSFQTPLNLEALNEHVSGCTDGSKSILNGCT